MRLTLFSLIIYAFICKALYAETSDISAGWKELGQASIDVVKGDYLPDANLVPDGYMMLKESTKSVVGEITGVSNTEVVYELYIKTTILCYYISLINIFQLSPNILHVNNDRKYCLKMRTI